eukprot:jgi/Mesvir1/22405/Mv17891-RA.1
MHPSGHTVWSAVPLDSHHGGDIPADTLRGGAGMNTQRVVRYRLGTAGTSGSQRPQSTYSSIASGMRARGPAPKKPAHCDPSPNSGDPGNPPNASMCEDAVWYHVPDIQQATEQQRRISRPRPDVVLVVVSFESSGNYPLLKSRAFMSQFDIEADLPEDATQAKGFFRPPLLTAEKLKAIVTVNSNCHTKNHREELVKRLMDRFEVHSYGDCLKNRNDTIPTHFKDANIHLYSKYRFCVAMENSNAVDYACQRESL